MGRRKAWNLSSHHTLLPLLCDLRRRLGTTQQLGIIASICAPCMKREINAYRLIRTKKNRVAIKIKTDNPPPIPPASNPTGIPAKRETFSQKQTHMFKSNARKLSMNSVKIFPRPSLLYSRFISF